MFTRRASSVEIPTESRSILIAGGSGEVGQMVYAARPADVFITNVSKSRGLSGASTVNCAFDLLHEPEKAVKHLASLLPFVDVFVYAPYARIYTPFERIERARLLKEFELGVYVAALMTRLVAERFWSGQREENVARARKVILLSSAAGLRAFPRRELATYSAVKAAMNALGPYAHDYMRKTYGVSVHALAPDSVSVLRVGGAFTKRFWELVGEPATEFTLEDIS